MKRACGSCKYYENGVCTMAKMTVLEWQICPAYDLDKEGIALLKALDKKGG